MYLSGLSVCESLERQDLLLFAYEEKTVLHTLQVAYSRLELTAICLLISF